MKESKVYGLRCSPALLEQCDELVEPLASDTRLSPMGIACRADVMRHAIVRGLPLLKKELKKSQ